MSAWEVTDTWAPVICDFAINRSTCESNIFVAVARHDPVTYDGLPQEFKSDPNLEFEEKNADFMGAFILLMSTG